MVVAVFLFFQIYDLFRENFYRVIYILKIMVKVENIIEIITHRDNYEKVNQHSVYFIAVKVSFYK